MGRIAAEPNGAAEIVWSFLTTTLSPVVVVIVVVDVE